MCMYFCFIHAQLIRTLLEDLPRVFAENNSVQSAMGAALQAATKLLVSEPDKHTLDYSHVCYVTSFGSTQLVVASLCSRLPSQTLDQVPSSIGMSLLLLQRWYSQSFSSDAFFFFVFFLSSILT